MASRIQGITIKINGDTKNLSTSLKEVNKQINQTQSALRDVEKLLKMDPGNTELLKQKHELLAKAVSETKEKLEQLKNAQAQMDAEGVDKSSKAYLGLQREILATENSLKSLEAEAKQSNVTLQKVSATAGKVAEGAGQVANATKGLSMAAGGALAAIGGLGVKAAQDADELNTLAKQTGLSTEALQKMKYASDLVDVDVETITGAVTKMKKGLDSNADAFEKIGVAVKDANGEYRDTESIFYDTVQALGQIQNETERDIVAMDIFGKSADELAGIIDDGGAAMKALGQEAENKGLIISKEDLDAANELNDTLDKTKAQIQASLGKASVSVAQSLAPVLEQVASVIEKIADVIKNTSPETIKLITTILAVIAVISPIASVIAKIATVVQTLIPIITTLNAVLAANPIGIVVIAVAALVAGFIALWNNCEGFRNFFINMWEGIKEFFGKIADWFGEVFEKIAGFFSGLKEKAGEVKDGIAEKWNSLKENTAQAWDNIKEKTSQVWDAVKGKIEENGGGIKGYLVTVAEGYKSIWEGAFNKLDEITGGKLSDVVRTVIDKLSSIRDAFWEKIEAAKTWGRDLVQNFIDGIMEKWNAFKDKIAEMAQTVKDFIGFSEPKKGPLSNFHTFAPDMIELFGQGIEQSLNKLNAPMTALANAVKPDTNVNVNMNDSAITSRLDSIGSTLNREQTPIPVSVVLSPNAQGLFDVVRTENQKFKKSTGQSAF